MVPHLKLASHATRQPSRKPSLRASPNKEARQKCCAADVAAFKGAGKGAGYDNRAVLDMLALAATRLISNCTNRLAETPNDSFMKGAQWTAPGGLKPAA